MVLNLCPFSFTVIAHDHGEPPRLGFVNVTVLLDDVNDNEPRCVTYSQRVSNCKKSTFQK